MQEKEDPPLLRWLKRFFRLCALFLLVATVLPFFADTVWWFDLFSHFVFQFAIVALVGLGATLMTKQHEVVVCCALMLGWHAYQLWPYRPPLLRGSSEVLVDEELASKPRLRLVMTNVLTSNQDRETLPQWIAEVDPDIIGILETSEEWLADLDEPLAAWPHRISDPRDDNFGIALFSRIPFESAELSQFLEGTPQSILARIHWEGESVPLLLTHPIPPLRDYLDEMLELQVTLLLREQAAQAPNGIVFGDFNSSPWSKNYARVIDAGLSDARVGYKLDGTWPAWGPSVTRIPIDHIFVGPDWKVLQFITGPTNGSDHLPVFAELVAR